jgi:hypothetical protein
MSSKIANTSANANSICIPRAFANISEARVRKVFDALNIFVIDRIDMIQRKNEKGDAYQRIFVHIKEWSNTADADKARERLLSGKELKIVYDEPWFWKVSLNNWTPKPAPTTSLYDRKPRIRLDFEDEKNAEAAASFLSEDQRPYRERRLDPILCEQDVQSGFRDRRLPRENAKKEQRKSRFSAKPETSLPIAPGLPDIVVKDPPEIQKPNPTPPEIQKPNPTPPEIQKPNPTPPVTVVKDPFLVLKMQALFRVEITDDIYLANRQMMREMLKESKETELEETEVINYGNVPAPKRKGRRVVE